MRNKDHSDINDCCFWGPNDSGLIVVQFFPEFVPTKMKSFSHPPILYQFSPLCLCSGVQFTSGRTLEHENRGAVVRCKSSVVNHWGNHHLKVKTVLQGGEVEV